MTDLEELLTDHLRRKAAAVTTRYDLEAVERGICSVELVHVDDRSNRPPWTAVLTTAAAAVALLGITIVGTRDDSTTEPSSTIETSPVATASLAVLAGGWTSSGPDGGALDIAVAVDGSASVTIRDAAADACSGTAATMTGTGTLNSRGDLVVAIARSTCEDGSEPAAPAEQHDDLVFAHDRVSDTLTDSSAAVWRRDGPEDAGPAPRTSATMWPQSTLDEVRAAQELADAGHPGYAWQVDAQLASGDGWSHLARPGRVELVDRFLRDELGWEEYLFSVWQGTDGDGASDGVHRGSVFLRCAPGRTNPLYPRETCAPTLDDLRFETVSIDIAQLDRRGPDGIWVVSDWRMMAPFTQTDPDVAEADATALLDEFLAARVAGGGAEGYVAVTGGESHLALDEVPLLYASSAGAPYERFEVEHVSGPRWPYGEMEFRVRLFADGGETVVEQPISFHEAGGRLRPMSDATETTEDGRPVVVPYEFFDGEVVVSADAPWEANVWTVSGLSLGDNSSDELVQFTRDPLPAAANCTQGLAVADGAALAQAILSDPNLESTAPVAVTVGGASGLQMDITQAPAATTCPDAGFGLALVLTKPTEVISRFADSVLLGPHDRMRLYLIDLPEGSVGRVLAVAVTADETRFDEVAEAAAPIIESIEFHTTGP